MSEQTDFEKQQERILGNYRMMPSVNAGNLGPVDFLINALGGDPSQDILVLCQSCGVTTNPECAYGGFHDEGQWVRVSVDWMPSRDGGEHGDA